MSMGEGSTAPSFGTSPGLAGPVVVVQRVAFNLVRWVAVLGRPPRGRPPRPGGGALVAAAVTVAAIVASMFFLDVVASTWAVRLPRWLVDFADSITNFGRSSWFLYPLGVILLALAAGQRPALPASTRRVLAALAGRFGFMFVAIALPSLFDTVVKRLIGRARPYVGTHDDPFNYRPFAWEPNYASMPSGHATTAAAAAVAIGIIWPQMRPVMWLYALIIMASRVVINVHHPSDVLAGALVGVVGALMVRRWFAARGLVFCVGDLQPNPGPSWRLVRAAARSVLGRAQAPT